MNGLHMLRLPLHGRRLTEFGHTQGLIAERWTADVGYLVHAAFSALFGAAAPKPFLIEREDADPLPVLAYADRSLAELQAEAGLHADPVAHALVDWNRAASKPMPLPVPRGRRLSFRVRVCPTVRIARSVAAFRAGAEVDPYVAWLREQGFPKCEERDPRKREEVYLRWLKARMGDGAAVRLEKERLEELRGVQLWRKGAISRERMQAVGISGNLRGRGRGVISDRRAVVFSGTLVVVDAEAFTRLIRRGIGRHRAFGFGMLLLRPAGEP